MVGLHRLVQQVGVVEGGRRCSRGLGPADQAVLLRPGSRNCHALRFIPGEPSIGGGLGVREWLLCSPI